MDRMDRAASGPMRVYLVGGCSAVIIGWRDATIDVDLAIRPSDDALLRAIPELKNALDINIELASPADFIPLPSGWENRSLLISRREQVAFHHFDFYSQALAKLERGHRQDVADVRAMLEREGPARAGPSLCSGRQPHPCIAFGSIQNTSQWCPSRS